MRRRDFISAAAVGTVSLPATVIHGKATKPAVPAGFMSPKVAIGRGVYAEAKFPKTNGQKAPESKVPGTMVSLTAAIPNGISPFYVTLFIQFRSPGGWQFVACDPRFTDYYQFQGNLRDIMRLSSFGYRVTLFVPDAAHNLPAGISFELRPVIRFWTLQNEVLADLDQVLPSEAVRPQVESSRRTITFARGDENPPFEVYDLITGDWRKLS